jgi:hypothetical protein
MTEEDGGFKNDSYTLGLTVTITSLVKDKLMQREVSRWAVIAFIIWYSLSCVVPSSKS